MRDRGGRFARKAWSQLSEKTRRENLAHGIGEAEHAAGVSVKQIRRLEGDALKYYGVSAADVRQELASLNMVVVDRAARDQVRMVRLYEQGKHVEARALWEQRDQSLPEWMFFYHGIFS